MPPAPEGAQASDDGRHWWDGTQWVPVDGDTPGSEPSKSTPVVTDETFAQMLEAAEGDAQEV